MMHSVSDRSQEFASITFTWRSLSHAAALAALLLTPANEASAVTLQLTSATSSENTFELKLIIGIANDTDTTTAVGNVEVEFEHAMVDSDAVITGIELTGGQIDFESISFSFFFRRYTDRRR